MCRWSGFSKSFDCSARRIVIACVCAHINFAFYVRHPQAYVSVPVLLQHLCSFLLCLEDSYASVLFFFFCFFFCGWKRSRLSQLPGLWLTIAHSQDASAPATHRGAMGALQESCSSGLLSSMLSNSPLLCSLLVTLHYVVVSKGDSGEDPKRKYWTCLKIDCSYVVISDNNTNCPFTARIF